MIPTSERCCSNVKTAMPPKKGKKKGAAPPDPAAEAAAAKRLEMIRHAARLQKAIQFEEQEAANLQLSKLKLHHDWVLYQLLVTDLALKLSENNDMILSRCVDNKKKQYDPVRPSTRI